MSSQPSPRSPPHEPSPRRRTTPGAASFELAAQPARLEEHVRTILDVLPPEVARDEVCAGLSEALGNAIIHGALGVSYERRRAGDLEGTLDEIDAAARRLGDTTTVRVDVRHEDGCTRIVITDPGPGFDWRSDEPTGGLGLTILRGVFAEVTWNERGNAITLTLPAP